MLKNLMELARMKSCFQIIHDILKRNNFDIHEFNKDFFEFDYKYQEFLRKNIQKEQIVLTYYIFSYGVIRRIENINVDIYKKYFTCAGLPYKCRNIADAIGQTSPPILYLIEIHRIEGLEECLELQNPYGNISEDEINRFLIKLRLERLISDWEMNFFFKILSLPKMFT